MYCLSCRQDAEIKEGEQKVEEFVSKNGRRMLRALCSRCGHTVTTFAKKQESEEKEEKEEKKQDNGGTGSSD